MERQFTNFEIFECWRRFLGCTTYMVKHIIEILLMGLLSNLINDKAVLRQISSCYGAIVGSKNEKNIRLQLTHSSSSSLVTYVKSSNLEPTEWKNLNDCKSSFICIKKPKSKTRILIWIRLRNWCWLIIYGFEDKICILIDFL